MEYTVYLCPACATWSLQGVELVTQDEIEDTIREHLFECFGVPAEMRAA